MTTDCSTCASLETSTKSEAWDDWENFVAGAKGREALVLHDWLRRLSLLVHKTGVHLETGRGGGKFACWDHHAELDVLYREAEALRPLARIHGGDVAAWEAPFNAFRQAFCDRDEAAVRAVIVAFTSPEQWQ